MCGILLESALVFIVSVAVHVGVWRVRRPDSYRAWLPMLVVIFLGIGPAVAWWLLDRRLLMPSEPRPDALTELAAVLLLHGAASSVYIIGYTLLSAFSPSIEVMKRIDRAPDGIAPEEIDVPFLRTTIGGERVTNLIGDGLLVVDGDSVRLSPRASRLAAIALIYRHAIGLPDGTGG